MLSSRLRKGKLDVSQLPDCHAQVRLLQIPRPAASTLAVQAARNRRAATVDAGLLKEAGKPETLRCAVRRALQFLPRSHGPQADARDGRRTHKARMEHL